jgi:pimeloyl-ACP methyl ester carboxylesterase
MLLSVACYNYDYKDALHRAEKFMPNVVGFMIPNAKHLVNIDQPEVVNKKIINFLLPPQQ